MMELLKKRIRSIEISLLKLSIFTWRVNLHDSFVKMDWIRQLPRYFCHDTHIGFKTAQLSSAMIVKKKKKKSVLRELHNKRDLLTKAK